MRGILTYCCLLFLLSSIAYAGVCWDDFEDGNADGWNAVSGEWEVQEGAYVHLTEDPEDGEVYRTIIQSPWEFVDGTIEATIRFDRKSDGNEIPAILYRMIDDENGYAFRLHSDRLEVGRLIFGEYENIRGDGFPIDIEDPCEIKLEVEGIFTKIYYNSVIKSRIGEPDTKRGFDKGKIGFAVFDADKPIYFDGISIDGGEVYPFAPLGKSVSARLKLTTVWGKIKSILDF